MANTPSTTDPIQIKDIRDGVIILKDDSIRGIAQIDAINFELRSTDEQTAIIQQFQGFLNSIDFPLQVVIHSRKYNIETYVAGVEQAATTLDNELLKLQAQEYTRFVRELSELANIMSKRFYVVIALQVTASPQSSTGGGIMASIKGLFKKKKPVPVTPGASASGVSDQDVQTYKLQLQQRADLILGGLSGMGLKGRVLEQADLLTLFGDLYNPVVASEASQPSQPTQ